MPMERLRVTSFWMLNRARLIRFLVKLEFQRLMAQGWMSLMRDEILSALRKRWSYMHDLKQMKSGRAALIIFLMRGAKTVHLI